MAKAAPIYRMTHPDEPLRKSAPVLMIRLNEMLEWSASIHDPACVAELHNMRIAAKRLRYTLELFLPVLNEDAPPLLKVAEDIQEQIGLIHDCDMLFPLLTETLHEEMDREKRKATKRDSGGPPAFMAAEGLVTLMAKKRAERENRYREFLAYWDTQSSEGLVDRFAQVVAVATGVTEA